MEFRLRFIFLLLVAFIAAAVWTFPAWRGAFRQPSASDPFPGLSLPMQEQFLSLPLAQREELLNMHRQSPSRALEMVALALEGDSPAPIDELGAALEGAAALARGDFIVVNALNWGEGSAAIYELADGRRILRFKDFRSPPGADARVYLARDLQPLSALELGSDFLDLGRLKGNIGEQSYFLSDDHDWTIYRSAVVFSRHFDTVITVATLR